MKRQICFTLALILGCQPLVGCTTWSVQALHPREIVQERHPDKVRVRLTDGREIILEKPGVIGDSLVGGDPTLGKPVDVPVSAIDQIEIRKTSASKTALLLMGFTFGLAAILAIGILVECSGGNSCFGINEN